MTQTTLWMGKVQGFSHKVVRHLKTILPSRSTARGNLWTHFSRSDSNLNILRVSYRIIIRNRFHSHISRSISCRNLKSRRGLRICWIMSLWFRLRIVLIIRKSQGGCQREEEHHGIGLNPVRNLIMRLPNPKAHMIQCKFRFSSQFLSNRTLFKRKDGYELRNKTPEALAKLRPKIPDSTPGQEEIPPINTGRES